MKKLGDLGKIAMVFDYSNQKFISTNHRKVKIPPGCSSHLLL